MPSVNANVEDANQHTPSTQGTTPQSLSQSAAPIPTHWLAHRESQLGLQNERVAEDQTVPSLARYLESSSHKAAQVGSAAPRQCPATRTRTHWLMNTWSFWKALENGVGCGKGANARSIEAADFSATRHRRRCSLAVRPPAERSWWRPLVVVVGVVAVSVVPVKVGVRIGKLLPNSTTCGAMGCWHALPPPQCCSAINARAKCLRQ